MKELITNLVLFIVFSIIFSGLTACTGTQSVTTNTNAATSPVVAGSETTDKKSSVYPPLASGLADAEFELLDGSTFKISDRKGKVLLLNIWGTWCGPCKAEMPYLVALQDEYGSRGFEVIGLNIGDGSGTPEPIELINSFAEKMKLNYTLARSSTAATTQFYLITKQQVVPQTILVDREGHLRGVFVGGGPRIVNLMQETVAKTMSE